MNNDISNIPHVNNFTSITAAMSFWEIYLSDQEKSDYTIKAFLGDLRLLTKFLPPDIAIGDITNSDLNSSNGQKMEEEKIFLAAQKVYLGG